MTFEVEKLQAALIPLALLRLEVQEVIPSCSRQERVLLTSEMALRALIRYQLRARDGL